MTGDVHIRVFGIEMVTDKTGQDHGRGTIKIGGQQGRTMFWGTPVFRDQKREEIMIFNETKIFDIRKY